MLLWAGPLPFIETERLYAPLIIVIANPPSQRNTVQHEVKLTSFISSHFADSVPGDLPVLSFVTLTMTS